MTSLTGDIKRREKVCNGDALLGDFTVHNGHVPSMRGTTRAMSGLASRWRCPWPTSRSIAHLSPSRHSFGLDQSLYFLHRPHRSRTFTFHIRARLDLLCPPHHSTFPASNTMSREVGYYYHHPIWPAEGVMDDVHVVHDAAECTAHRASGANESSRISSHRFINGIYVATTQRPPNRNYISNLHSPPFSAMMVKNWGNSMNRDSVEQGYVADHHFVPRELQPGDGGDDFVRQAYARCEGCFARGYHLPETELRCFAFGVPEPPHPPPETRDWPVRHSATAHRSDAVTGASAPAADAASVSASTPSTTSARRTITEEPPNPAP